MNNEIFKNLLDQAEQDFRAEATEIAMIARPSQQLPDLTAALDSAGQHPAELAPEIAEREIAAGILAETTEMLAEIVAARKRLSVGTFGTCESCGGTINIERLMAVPWARRCASDERAHQSEARGYQRNVAPPSWLPTETEQEDTVQGSMWDPEDDHPIIWTEESAIHDVTAGGQ